MLIALALLGFVLLGITPLFMASVKSNYSGNEYTSINMLARDRLEQLMNLPFIDDQLKPGKHDSDLLATKLPDPKTGLPALGPGALNNPFTVCYQVLQLQIPSADIGTVPLNQPFTPIEITDPLLVFHYKRIDVTVKSGTGPLGIGTRATRVSGVVSNPFPGPLTCAACIVSQPDTGSRCP
jgi:hypothetical protein